MVAMTRGSGLAAALALAGSACLSVPPYEPPPSALTYAEDAGGASVAAEGFVLHFAGGGFHFPDVLAVDGINTLGHDQNTKCYAEDGVGMVIYPTARISASTTAAVTTSQVASTMRGPAVVQVRVDWSSEFSCSDNHPFGSSLYTVFLDGRIVRHDSIDDHMMAPTSVTMCACDPSEHQGFQIESFWRFNPGVFKMYSVPDGGTLGEIPLPKDPIDTFDHTNFYIACLDAESYQVAIALSRSKNIVGTPKTVISPTAAVFDRERTGGFVSTLDPLGWDTNDAVFVEHGTGCKRALERASEHASASSLVVNGDPIAVSLVNGIYGGDAGDDSKLGVKVPPGRVELAGPINSSFAVWLRFTSGVDGVRAQLAGKTGAWYVLQRIDAANWIAWFRDPLMPAETIAIETD